jgi:hypothetical protein
MLAGISIPVKRRGMAIYLAIYFFGA